MPGLVFLMHKLPCLPQSAIYHSYGGLNEKYPSSGGSLGSVALVEEALGLGFESLNPPATSFCFMLALSDMSAHLPNPVSTPVAYLHSFPPRWTPIPLEL